MKTTLFQKIAAAINVELSKRRSRDEITVMFDRRGLADAYDALGVCSTSQTFTHIYGCKIAHTDNELADGFVVL